MKAWLSPCFALLLGSFVHGFSGSDFTVCHDLPSDHAHVSALSYLPNPVAPGKDLNVSFKATPDVYVYGGTLKLSHPLLGSIGTYDICKQAGIACPVKPGETVDGLIAQPIPMSALIVAGETITVRIEIRTEIEGVHNSLAGCLNVPVTIGTGFFRRMQNEAVTAPSRALRRALRSTAQEALAQVPTLMHAVASAEPEWMDLWALWKKSHRKLYATQVEEARRFQIFQDNLLHRNDNGLPIHLDERSDLLHEEHHTLAHFA